MVKKPYELGLKKGIGYSLHRYYVDEFFYSHRKDFAKAKHILDLGGEKENKRGQFNLYDHTDKVTNINLKASKGVDILGNAAELPVKNNCFDVVICAELLEHVPDPVAVLKEIKRTLKKGGKAYITVPFIFPIHADPYDYGRYTPAFWERVADSVGLKVESIAPQGSYINVLLDMVRMGVYRKVENKYLKFTLYLPVRFLQKIMFKKDAAARKSKDKFANSFTTGFEIILKKYS